LYIKIPSLSLDSFLTWRKIPTEREKSACVFANYYSLVGHILIHMADFLLLQCSSYLETEDETQYHV